MVHGHLQRQHSFGTTLRWPSSLPASPVAFFGQISSAFSSVPGVLYRGSCLRSSAVLGVLHSQHPLPTRLDFSIVHAFPYLRVPSEHSYSPRFGSNIFHAGGVPNLPPQAQLPQQTISFCWGASPLVDAVGRLVPLASTRFCINPRHKGTLDHTKTLSPARRGQSVICLMAKKYYDTLC